MHVLVITLIYIATQIGGRIISRKGWSQWQVPCLRLPLSVCIQKLYVMPVSQRHAHSPFISYQISIHFQPFSVGGDHGISLIGSGLASESQHHEGRRVEPTPLWLPAEPHKFLSVTATRKQISFFHSGNFCDNGNPCSTVFFFSSVIPSMVASNLKGKKPVLNAQWPFLLLILGLSHIPFVKSLCPSLSPREETSGVPRAYHHANGLSLPIRRPQPQTKPLGVHSSTWTHCCANTPDSAWETNKNDGVLTYSKSWR